MPYGVSRYWTCAAISELFVGLIGVNIRADDALPRVPREFKVKPSVRDVHNVPSRQAGQVVYLVCVFEAKRAAYRRLLSKSYAKRKHDRNQHQKLWNQRLRNHLQTSR